MHNPENVLNWWLGRISDQNLADWSGMAPRAVGFVLQLPLLRRGVLGGGRGSKHTRRILPQTRNSVAIIQALNNAGLTLEVAANIIAATPVIADEPTEFIDRRHWAEPMAYPAVLDPKGGWLLTDAVPKFIWEFFKGDYPIARKAHALATVERDSIATFAIPMIDLHLVIVDGRWVFIKIPEDLEVTNVDWKTVLDEENLSKTPNYEFHPISVIGADGKIVRSIFGEPEEWAIARQRLKNYVSLVDVNLSLAIRQMKARAYDLSEFGGAA